MYTLPTTRGYLDAACKHDGIFTMEEIEQELDPQTAKVFEHPECAALTHLISDCEGLALEIHLAGGELNALVALEQDEIVPYAKSLGCKHVYILGRPGWKRVLTGYQARSELLRKAI